MNIDSTNIDVSSISEGAVLTVDYSFDADCLTEYLPNVNFIKPINIHGSFKNTETKLNFIGTINTVAILRCDRCLSDVHFDINIPINEFFVNSHDVDNVNSIYFDGKIINLREFVVQIISFCLPLKVLCKDKCNGLCPICGVNLNDGECNCDNSYVNPHFECLRSLFEEP